MKTIGVLGGIGPQATMDSVARVHRVAQGLIPAHFNGGYPPLAVYYHRRPPIVVDEDHRPVQPMQPDPGLLAAAQQIGAMADFLVITANGPHSMLSEFEAATGRPVLSMIEVTLAEVQRRGWSRVGVVGLGEPVVYLGPLSGLGLEAVTVPAELQAPLDEAVFAVMAGQEDARSAAAAGNAIKFLRMKKVDGIIPGCTELPFLLENLDDQPDMVNPIQLLAEAAVRRAMD